MGIIIGVNHAIVIFFAILGLIIGGILIDLDHKGTWDCKYKKFWRRGVDCEISRGFTHNHIFMLSTASFCISLGIGILIHYWMDFIPLP